MLDALRMARIIIDAGHGGSVRAGNSSAYGSRGSGGLLEKDVTLDIARQVVARLGGDAALTRTDDSNLSLGARAARSARDGADVFVSIHANSGPPEVAGPETWVHPDAGDGSHRLAGGIQRALERLVGRYGGSAESRRGPMAVLSPGAIGRRTSACLVEVDYLSNPRGEQRLGDPRERAAIGAAIAGAIREHVASSRFGPHGRQASSVEPSSHQRVGRARWAEAASTPAAAAIAAFAGGSGSSVWHSSLTRSAVATRLSALAANPDLVDQNGLNLCGPAAFFHLWFNRDALSAVNYATALFETGTGAIGSLSVAPGRDLKAQDYGTVAGSSMQAADWMMLSALRDWENDGFDFEGTPAEDASGITTPAELAKWMRASGMYSTVDDEGNWFFTKGLPHALALAPSASRDIIMLINATMISSAASGRKRSLAALFPNHYVRLLDPITRSGSDVTFRYWTWGLAPASATVSVSVFEANYYGSVTGNV